MAVLVNHRRLRACAPQRGSGSEDELEVFVGFFIAKNSLGDLEQTSKLDKSRHTRADWRLEYLVSDEAEAQRAQPGLVGNAQKVVAFRERADGATFAFRKAALNSLHQAA